MAPESSSATITLGGVHCCP